MQTVASVVIPPHLSHTSRSCPLQLSLVVARRNSSDLSVWRLASGLGCPNVDGEGKSTVEVGRFRLKRHKDPTGVSGTGHVADGWLLSDGVVVVRWLGQYGTTTVHHKGLASVEAIHCHSGATSIEWPDHEPVRVPDLGFSLVWRERATPFEEPGWLVSLDSVEGDPVEWNRAIDEGGPQSATLRHGDHVISIDDEQIGNESALRLFRRLHDSVGRIAARTLSVSRRVLSLAGDPGALTIALV